MNSRKSLATINPSTSAGAVAREEARRKKEHEESRYKGAAKFSFHLYNGTKPTNTDLKAQHAKEERALEYEAKYKANPRPTGLPEIVPSEPFVMSFPFTATTAGDDKARLAASYANIEHYTVQKDRVNKNRSRWRSTPSQAREDGLQMLDMESMPLHKSQMVVPTLKDRFSDKDPQRNSDLTAIRSSLSTLPKRATGGGYLGEGKGTTGWDTIATLNAPYVPPSVLLSSERPSTQHILTEPTLAGTLRASSSSGGTTLGNTSRPLTGLLLNSAENGSGNSTSAPGTASTHGSTLLIENQFISQSNSTIGTIGGASKASNNAAQQGGIPMARSALAANTGLLSVTPMHESPLYQGTLRHLTSQPTNTNHRSEKSAIGTNVDLRDVSNLHALAGIHSMAQNRVKTAEGLKSGLRLSQSVDLHTNTVSGDRGGVQALSREHQRQLKQLEQAQRSSHTSEQQSHYTNSRPVAIASTTLSVGVKANSAHDTAMYLEEEDADRKWDPSKLESVPLPKRFDTYGNLTRASQGLKPNWVSYTSRAEAEQALFTPASVLSRSSSSKKVGLDASVTQSVDVKSLPQTQAILRIRNPKKPTHNLLVDNSPTSGVIAHETMPPPEHSNFSQMTDSRIHGDMLNDTSYPDASLLGTKQKSSSFRSYANALHSDNEPKVSGNQYGVQLNDAMIAGNNHGRSGPRLSDDYSFNVSAVEVTLPPSNTLQNTAQATVYLPQPSPRAYVDSLRAGTSREADTLSALSNHLMQNPRPDTQGHQHRPTSLLSAESVRAQKLLPQSNERTLRSSRTIRTSQSKHFHDSSNAVYPYGPRPGTTPTSEIVHHALEAATIMQTKGKDNWKTKINSSLSLQLEPGVKRIQESSSILHSVSGGRRTLLFPNETIVPDSLDNTAQFDGISTLNAPTTPGTAIRCSSAFGITTSHILPGVYAAPDVPILSFGAVREGIEYAYPLRIHNASPFTRRYRLLLAGYVNTPAAPEATLRVRFRPIPIPPGLTSNVALLFRALHPGILGGIVKFETDDGQVLSCRFKMHVLSEEAFEKVRFDVLATKRLDKLFEYTSTLDETSTNWNVLYNQAQHALGNGTDIMNGSTIAKHGVDSATTLEKSISNSREANSRGFDHLSSRLGVTTPGQSSSHDDLALVPVDNDENEVYSSAVQDDEKNGHASSYPPTEKRNVSYQELRINSGPVTSYAAAISESPYEMDAMDQSPGSLLAQAVKDTADGVPTTPSDLPGYPGGRPTSSAINNAMLMNNIPKRLLDMAEAELRDRDMREHINDDYYNPNNPALDALEKAVLGQNKKTHRKLNISELDANVQAAVNKVSESNDELTAEIQATKDDIYDQQTGSNEEQREYENTLNYQGINDDEEEYYDRPAGDEHSSGNTPTPPNQSQTTHPVPFSSTLELSQRMITKALEDVGENNGPNFFNISSNTVSGYDYDKYSSKFSKKPLVPKSEHSSGLSAAESFLPLTVDTATTKPDPHSHLEAHLRRPQSPTTALVTATAAVGTTPNTLLEAQIVASRQKTNSGKRTHTPVNMKEGSSGPRYKSLVGDTSNHGDHGPFNRFTMEDYNRGGFKHPKNPKNRAASVYEASSSINPAFMNTIGDTVKPESSPIMIGDSVIYPEKNAINDKPYPLTVTEVAPRLVGLKESPNRKDLDHKKKQKAGGLISVEDKAADLDDSSPADTLRSLLRGEMRKTIQGNWSETITLRTCPETCLIPHGGSHQLLIPLVEKL